MDQKYKKYSPLNVSAVPLTINITGAEPTRVNMNASPYRSDCTDHFRTAKDSTIDFPDTTGIAFVTPS